MLWIYLIILQILFFIGLLFFLRYVLTRNITKATGHLEELSKDYLSKEEEANQLLENAQKESKGIMAKEIQSAEEAKEKLICEAQEMRDKILHEAHQKGEEVTEKAEKNAEFLRNELEQKIDDRAKQKVCEIIHHAIPEDFLKDVHERWVEESDKGDFNLKHLKLSDDIKEVTVTSAFSLSDDAKEKLQKKIEKKVEHAMSMFWEEDSSLLAGFVIKIGSVVADASLKLRIHKAIQER